MKLIEYLRENAPLHKNRESLVLATMKEFNLARKKVSRKICDIQTTNTPLMYNCFKEENKQLKENSKPVFKGFSESEIRAKHDLRFIIANIVSGLEKGVYISDTDFVKQCNIKSHMGYRQVLEDTEFKKYKGRASGITYWSHPESISKMKEEGILT